MPSRLARLATIRAASQTGTSRNVRLAAGLSLREVADYVDVGVSTIYRWETGERQPRGKAALRYSDLIAELEGSRDPA
jgi:transcriptional regulator with XRE-family HTH domain